MASTAALLDAFRADGASDDAVEALASLELSADDLLDVDPSEVWGVRAGVGTRGSRRRRGAPTRVATGCGRLRALAAWSRALRCESSARAALAAEGSRADGRVGERRLDGSQTQVGDRDAAIISATCARLRHLESGPLIFLDIDVLNRAAKATHVRLDDDLTANLRRITAATGAKIVFSTYWREFDAYLRYVLGRYDVKAFAGSTAGAPATRPSDRTNVRGDEVRAFLGTCAPGCRYVILDDRDDFLDEQRSRHVRTDPATGLTEALADRAIALLTEAPG